MRNMIIPILLLLCACNSQEEKKEDPVPELKNFYFPYAAMFDTLVYHYQTDDGATRDMYWVMYTTTQQQDTFFHSYNFSHDENIFLTIENMREKITPEGAIIEKFQTIFLNPISGNGYQHAEITKDYIYKWNLAHGDSLYFELISESEREFQQKQTTSKTRRFSKFDTILYWPVNEEEKPVKAACFEETFSIWTNTKEKSKKKSGQFTRTTWYAENIGFIKFIQHYGSVTVHGELKEIIPFQKWNRKDQFRAIMKEDTFVPFSGVH